METTIHKLSFNDHSVSVLPRRVEDAVATLIFGHGAGAGMQHATMTAIAEALAEVKISTVRFNFPYMEAGKPRVDSVDLSTRTFEAVYEDTKSRMHGPYFLGGHSFGGRMATHAIVDRGLDAAGLILCSFPLHNPNKPSLQRASHMSGLSCPILFLSGSRDGMANTELMQELSSDLNATLHWLDTADHGYKVLKRTRERSDTVFEEIAAYTLSFVS